jgi:hypothetical protein
MEIKYEDEYGSKRLVTPHAQTFTIDPTNIDSELCGLGRVSIEFAEVECILKTEVEKKENSLSKLEADLDIHLRTKAQTEGTKITEKTLDSLVNSNETRLELIESLRISRDNYNKIKWVMKTLLSKKDCLIALAYRDRELIKADRYSS